MAAAAITSELNDLGWNDLKKCAKDNGIKVQGTRDEITAELVGNLAKNATNAPLSTSKSVNIMKLTTPKTAGKSVRKSTRKSLAAEKIIFTVPDENVNNGSTAEEAAILSPKKEAEVVSNKGPLSPQIHQRTGRKAMLRSPSPAPASPEPIPTAKKAAARSTRKSTRKAPKTEEKEPAAEAEDEVEMEAAKAAEAAKVKAVVEAAATAAAAAVEAPEPDVVLKIGMGHIKVAALALGLAAAAAVGAAARAAVWSSPLPAAALLPPAGGAFPAASSGAAVSFVPDYMAANPDGFGADDVALEGPSRLMLARGQAYHEHGVALSPAAHGLVAGGHGAPPSVAYEYSSPGMAFAEGGVDTLGAFEVEYTVSADWLNSDVKLLREVVVVEAAEAAAAEAN